MLQLLAAMLRLLATVDDESLSPKMLSAASDNERMMDEDEDEKDEATEDARAGTDAEAEAKAEVAIAVAVENTVAVAVVERCLPCGCTARTACTQQHTPQHTRQQ